MPMWLFPQVTNPANGVVVRLGRAIHWIAVGFAGMGIILTMTKGRGLSYVIAVVAMAFFLALLGRSVRYILSDE